MAQDDPQDTPHAATRAPGHPRPTPPEEPAPERDFEASLVERELAMAEAMNLLEGMLAPRSQDDELADARLEMLLRRPTAAPRPRPGDEEA